MNNSEKRVVRRSENLH